jgi:hypothetical protein
VIRDMEDWTAAFHKGTHSTEKLSELYCVYHDAVVEAKKLGFVGVGCITYAENKMKEYQK